MKKISIKEFDTVMCANKVCFIGGGFTKQRRLEETMSRAQSMSTEGMEVRTYTKKSYGLLSDSGSRLDHNQKHEWLYCWQQGDVLIHEQCYKSDFDGALSYNYCVYKIIK